ncbi:MAG: aldehyde dehydrogenase [Calditrichaeota bacterium]|nr:MAG: aldehyde dehydrogenase [Calditrichota bacterium]
MAKMFINGEWVASKSGQTYEVKNPVDGSVVDTVPAGDRADAEAAVEAAKSAFKEWAATPADQRAELLEKGVQLVKEQAKDLAAQLTREQGKPLMEAMGEINHFLHGMEFYVGMAGKVRGAQVPLPPSMNPNCYGVIMKQPVGVSVGIIPWNFPITLMGTKVGPALIAGNPIIIKPASTTPLTTLKIIGLLNEAGLPPGVLNCVTGSGSKVGAALITHPDVRRVALTGSSETGKQVMQLAGPDFKRITLELGGSDPMIVCPDADLGKAVNGAMIGRYWNAGQACLAVKRLYLFEEIYDAFLEKLVEKVQRYELGDGMVKAEKPRIRMGPLHTAFQRDEVEAQLKDAVEKGAEVLVGGKRPDDDALAKGHFFEPAVVTNVSEESRLMTEEVFGPVLPVFKVSSLDEAIEKANNSKWGLGASIWTNSMKDANRAAREIQSGMLWVNQIHYGYDEMPFGGVKASGIGHEHGPEALDYYFEPKSVVFGGLDS